MVILELMTQRDCYDLYDFDLKEVKREAIQERLREASLIGYSDKLINTIRSMLVENELDRMNITDLNHLC